MGGFNILPNKLGVGCFFTGIGPYFFENNIEMTWQKCKYFYAKVSYTPDYCESCGALNTNHTVVKNGFKNSRITIPKVSEMCFFSPSRFIDCCYLSCV